MVVVVVMVVLIVQWSRFNLMLLLHLLLLLLLPGRLQLRLGHLLQNPRHLFALVKGLAQIVQRHDVLDDLLDLLEVHMKFCEPGLVILSQTSAGQVDAG